MDPASRWESFTPAFIERIRRSDRVFVDVGAEFGFYTELALRHGQGDVLAFEPEPTRATFLKKSFRNSRVTVHECALYDRQAELPALQINPDFSPSLTRTEGNIRLRFHTERFDDLIADDVRLRVGVVKIDTEGAESAVLRGMMDTLHRATPVLFIEFHPLEWSKETEEDRAQLFLELARAGYAIPADAVGASVRNSRMVLEPCRASQ